MLTLEELKDKVKTDYKCFRLSPRVELDGEYVKSFTLAIEINDEVLVCVYFWDYKLANYISYFI